MSPSFARRPWGRTRATYSEESLLLITLLRTLWRLSYQDMRDGIVNLFIKTKVTDEL
jgi:hypothetical protein